MVFTARRLAKRGICCRLVCVSVTLWYCIKTTKLRITQITVYGTYGASGLTKS